MIRPFNTHRSRPLRTALAIVAAVTVAGLIGWALYCHTASKAGIQRAMTQVMRTGYYQLEVDGQPLLRFGTDHSRLAAVWTDRLALVPSCEGRLTVSVDDSLNAHRYAGRDIREVLAQKIDSLKKDIRHLSFKVDELAYYRRVHSVIDEGYETISRFSFQERKRLDSLRHLLDTLQCVKPTDRVAITYHTDYRVALPGKKTTEKWETCTVTDTLRDDHCLILQTESRQKPDGVTSYPKSVAAHIARLAGHNIRRPITWCHRPDSAGVYIGSVDKLFRPEGHGVHIGNDGTYFEGHWKAGRRNGFGFSLSNTQAMRVGEWRNDLFRGERVLHTSERIYGIDISKYQHEKGRKRYPIHWDKLCITHLGGISRKRTKGGVNYRVSFCYIKCTEGTTVHNKYYAADHRAARASGLHVGAYHFFSIRTGGAAQAAFFLRHARIRKGDLPPVLDVEPSPRQIKGMGGAAVLWREVRAWLKVVKRKTGVRPILYISQMFVNRYLDLAPDVKRDYEVWIARYGEYKPDVRMRFWQLCPDGRVRGIHGEVDVNVFNGYEAEFNTFTRSTQ